MANKLQEHFAMIRDREEVLNDIRSREEFLEMYQLWSDVIFFEKSTKEFHKFEDEYIHHSRQTTDTGLKIDLLQEYVFIALDI